jgi:melibiose permease/lactose/raffinose/galactose permease
MLFADFGLEGTGFVAMFAVCYLLWGLSYTVNDVSYWSMLPTLSVDQKEREKIGARARIFANIGLFLVVSTIVGLTAIWGDMFGGLQKGYFVFAIVVSLIMLGGQCVTLFGVKGTGLVTGQRQKTPLRELIRVIFKNDQLFVAAVAMLLFMIGYLTTTSFGLYFFKYAYGDEGMYGVFAIVLGLSQLTGLIIFPALSKRFERMTLFTAAIILITAGYTLFFFAPTDTMLFIGAAGILIFVGQSFVQLMMLMFLADTVDYGHWKLGRRNDSISFSLQPFIYKLGGAIASGVVSAVVIVTGISDAETAADVSAEGLLVMKAAMLIFPLICIITSYIICKKKYIVDSRYYARILADLRDRGEIAKTDSFQI